LTKKKMQAKLNRSKARFKKVVIPKLKEEIKRLKKENRELKADVKRFSEGVVRHPREPKKAA
jgi:cell division protein FtsB